MEGYEAILLYFVGKLFPASICTQYLVRWMRLQTPVSVFPSLPRSGVKDERVNYGHGFSNFYREIPQDTANAYEGGAVRNRERIHGNLHRTDHVDHTQHSAG